MTTAQIARESMGAIGLDWFVRESEEKNFVFRNAIILNDRLRWMIF